MIVKLSMSFNNYSRKCKKIFTKYCRDVVGVRGTSRRRVSDLPSRHICELDTRPEKGQEYRLVCHGPVHHVRPPGTRPDQDRDVTGTLGALQGVAENRYQGKDILRSDCRRRRSSTLLCTQVKSTHVAAGSLE